MHRRDRQRRGTYRRSVKEAVCELGHHASANGTGANTVTAFLAPCKSYMDMVTTPNWGRTATIRCVFIWLMLILRRERAL
jgi:hypothetical protein